MNIKEEHGVYSRTDRVIAEITNKREEYLQQKIIDYAKQHAEEYGEEVEVIFLDEDKVRMIIKLGIQEYLKRENEKGE